MSWLNQLSGLIQEHPLLTLDAVVVGFLIGLGVGVAWQHRRAAMAGDEKVRAIGKMEDARKAQAELQEQVERLETQLNQELQSALEDSD